MSWQEAQDYCSNQGLAMASPNSGYAQKKMAASLSFMNAEGPAWLGLRRSLIDSQWYWYNAGGFSYANWDQNEPTSSLCVSVWMEPGGDFAWNSVRCCSAMQPLCAQKMVIISSVDDTTSQI